MIQWNTTIWGEKMTPLSPEVFPMSSKSIMCNWLSPTESATTSDSWITAVLPQGIFHSDSAQVLPPGWFFDFILFSLPQSICSRTYSSKIKTGKLAETDLKTELPLVWLVKLCIPAPGWVKPKHPALSRPALSWRLDLKSPWWSTPPGPLNRSGEQRYLFPREN